MNLKNLFKLSALMFVFLFVLSSFSYGQTTYYVDVVNGLDGYNGLSSTVTGTPGVGPKQTIMNAIAAASAGDVISVAYANGNLYNEAVTVTKKLYFRSTGGTPNVVSFTVNNVGVSPANQEIFDSGTFKFTTALTLTAGKIIGASNITVAGAVTRTAGTVDSQLNYSGVLTFTYNGGVAITTGFELPAAGNNTNFGALVVNVAGTNVTFNSSKTILGNVTTTGGGTLALGGNTLTISGTGSNFSGGNVTGGTLAFVLTAATTVNGAVTLPTVTVIDDGASAFTLNLAQATTIGNITTDGTAVVTVTVATTVGNCTVNTASALTLTAATTVGSVTNNSTGTALLTAATATGSLSNTSSGIIDCNGAGLAVTGNISQGGAGAVDLSGVTAAVTVSGTVTNNPTLSVVTAAKVLASNYGVIIFPAQAVSVTGQVSNNVTFTGTLTASVTHANIGEIRFLQTTTSGTDIVLTGGVSINAQIASIVATSTKTLTLNNSGNVVFSATTANMSIVGGITVSSNIPTTSNATFSEVGSFLATARTTGLFGTSGSDRIGTITNNSSTGTAGIGGNIKVAATTNAGFWGTSISITGGKGGYTIFGNENTNLSGSVTSSKTVAGNYLDFGTAATATTTVSIAGNLDNEGASAIRFMAFNGAAAENFAVTGRIQNNGTGSIAINPASPLTGTGAFTFGGLDISNGSISLVGAGASAMNVTVNGTANFIGGTFDMTTSVSAATTLTATPVVIGANRILQLGGLQDTFGNAAGTTDFSAGGTLNANVVLLIQPTSVVAAQTVTGNTTTTVWPGILVVKNPTGLQPAVTFSGGNFRILKDVAFDLSQVSINGMTLFIGGQLAPAIGAGNFYNWPGYVTSNNGFVSMNGNAAKNAGGSGSFGNFEVDMAAGVTFAATATFTNTFNLTNGVVTGGAFVTFNNATVYPTIVRNAGTFAVAPTFTTMVNVYYIGLDKTTANELPLATNKLNNLTVATTNGAVAGKGTVQVAVATTVNGALNIFPNQALLLNGVSLTMKGATAQIDGVLANVGAGDRFILARTTGTVITGTGNGWLPDITVAAGSSGNSISGVKGLITTILGANNVWGTDDFNTATTQANGSITYLAGTNSLNVNFGTGAGTVAAGKTNINNLTLVDAGNTFTLNGSAAATGNIAEAAGTIAIGANTLTVYGTTHTMTEGALITGTGNLTFIPSAAATLTTTGTTVLNGPSIDVANLNFNTSTANFQLAAAGADLYVTGNFNLTGTTGSFDIAPARTLYAEGQNIALASGTSVIASGAGTGVLYSNILAGTGTQILSATGPTTIANLTVANNIQLALSGAGAATTVTGAFIHTGGQVNFGAYDLTITGTYNRTAGTYAATTGYLVLSMGGTFDMNQGATSFSIPNLRFTTNAVATAAGQTGVITVTNALDIQQPGIVSIKNANTGNGVILNIADGATVNYKGATASAFNVAPTYLGSVVFVANTAANAIVDPTIWPAALQPTTLRIANSGGAAVNFTLPGDRTVQNVIDLRVGILDLNTTPAVLTVTNPTVRRRQGGSVNVGAGTLTYTVAPAMYYEPSAAAAPGNIVTGAELPAVVASLTFTRTANVGNATTTLGTSVTVNGLTDIRNDVAIPVAPPTVTVNLVGNVSIALDAAYSNATAPVTTFNQPIAFTGTAQTLTIPLPGATIGAFTLNLATNSSTVTLVSPSTAVPPVPVTLTTGGVTFIKGLFVTNDNTISLPAPILTAGGGQGFDRTQMTAGSTSHIVGNCAKTLTYSGTLAGSSAARVEFPVGSMNLYRPVALNFNPQYGTPTVPPATIVVKHVDGVSPQGTVGLPIVNGVSTGVDVSRYPSFYWFIKSTPTVGPSTVFDLELTATGFVSYDDINNVRIIRRHSNAAVDLVNQWLLQGVNTGYDNSVNNGVPTIINRNATGGLRDGGAIFTLGMKSNLVVTTPVVNATAKVNKKADGTILTPTTFQLNLEATGAKMFGNNVGTLTYAVTSSNTSIATAALAVNILTVTPVAAGSADIAVTAYDASNNDFLTYHFTILVSVVGTTAPDAIPTTYAMSQNYPNPFNPTTAIKYQLPQESQVTIKVINMIGQEVATLVNEVKSAGYHTVNFNANGLASGRYIAIIKAGDFTKTIKMNLLK